MYKFREFCIPERMMGGMKRYVNDKVKPGNFLTAVIQNDLCGALGQADDENMRNLPAFVGWLYNEAPMACWGSKERMHNWLKGGAAEEVAEL